MHKQYCGRSEINFVTDRLTLPLLLASRVSARKNNDYITRTEQIIRKTCKVELKAKDPTIAAQRAHNKTLTTKQPNAKMRSVYEKRLGKYAENPQPCINVRRIKLVREHVDPKPFHLPPNIYETAKIPFENRRGLGGAYWHRLPETKSLLAGKTAEGENWQFYNIPRDIDRLNDRHNRYKGKFRAETTNSRSKLAVFKKSPKKDSLQITCNLQRLPISPNVTPRTATPKPNPHLFLHSSCVPEKLMSYILRHQSFLPAVGRYDVRSAKDCWSCMLSKKKRSNPQVTTVSSQMRSRSKRRLQHMLNATTLPQAKLLADKLDANIIAKFFPNYKQLQRVPISRRTQKLIPSLNSNIRFNTFIPLPRRVLKCPVTQATSMKKKIHWRRKEHKELAVAKVLPVKFEYKRKFKFLPLPSPKILTTKEAILADVITSESPCFYFQKLDVNKFLKMSTVNISED